GPLTCQRIRFSSFNPKTRYNGSLYYQNQCRQGPSAI
ncbi:Os08g0377150, partial [Oryza sativa Japonica Group]